MKIGFTGTRFGISDNQYRELVKFLTDTDITELHHGDCIGADAQAHAFTRIRKPLCTIVVHPPKINMYRAWCEGDVVKEPLDYLTRDRMIVDSVDLLIACPQTNHEIRQSGTWYTIRYAVKQNLEYIRFKR